MQVEYYDNYGRFRLARTATASHEWTDRSAAERRADRLAEQYGYAAVRFGSGVLYEAGDNPNTVPGEFYDE